LKCMSILSPKQRTLFGVIAARSFKSVMIDSNLKLDRLTLKAPCLHQIKRDNTRCSFSISLLLLSLTPLFPYNESKSQHSRGVSS
jgi:hypothetical protein